MQESREYFSYLVMVGCQRNRDLNELTEENTRIISARVIRCSCSCLPRMKETVKTLEKRIEEVKESE